MADFLSGINEDELTGFGIAIEKAIEVWGTEFEKQLELSLQEEGYGNSSLAKSLRFTVTPDGKNFRFKLFYNDYGDYLDQGVRGAGGTRRTTSKFNKSNNKGKIWKQNAPASQFSFKTKKPPLDALKKWSRARGLNEHAVQESVFRQGIKPTLWFTKVVNEDYVEGLVEALTQIGARQVEIDFVNAIKKGTAQ